MKEKNKKFNELNEDLQTHFIEMGIYGAGLVLIGIIAMFYTGSAFVFFLFVALALLYVLFIYYRLTLCYEGKIIYLEGEVVEVYNKKEVKEKFSLERPHFVISQNEKERIYIKIYYGNVKKIKEENIVKVYINPKGMRQINEDTYSCDNVFHVVVKRKSNAKEK